MTTYANAIVDRAEARFRDSSNYVITAAEWLGYLNESYREIIQARSLWPWLRRTTATVSVNGRSGTLPANCLYVEGVVITSGGAVLTPADDLNPPWVTYTPTQTGTPALWNVRGPTTLEVWPKTTGATNLTVSYVTLPSAFPIATTSSEAPAFDELFYYVLVDGMLAKAYADDGNKDWSEKHAALFAQGIEKMVAYYGNFRTDLSSVSDAWTALVERCTSRFRSAKAQLSISDWDDYLADAYKEVMQAHPLAPWLEQRQTSLSCVASTRTVALPDDCFQVRAVYNATSEFPLQQVHGGSTAHWTYGMTEVGTPEGYTFRGNALEIWPLPEAASTLTLDYIGLPSTFPRGGTTAEPAFPQHFWPILVDGALAKAYDDELTEIGNTKAKAFYDKFYNGIDRLRNFYLQVRGEYHVIQDTWGGVSF